MHYETSELENLYNLLRRTQRWLPEVSLVFVSLRQSWCHLIPMTRRDSVRQVRRFFDCTAALMSRHLRAMCMSSLHDLVAYMSAHGGDKPDGRMANPMLLLK